MAWYDFLFGRKKITLHQCKKILGQGAFGITYLTPDNLAIKIEPSENDKLTDGDEFAMNILPTLNYEVRKHFTQIYEISYIDYNPIPDLKCLEKNKSHLQTLKKAKKYKISVMEYGGKTLDSMTLSNEQKMEGFKQLFNPVCVMLSLGYSHNDLHIGNITYDENNHNFKIIDYNVMKKYNISDIINYKHILNNLVSLYHNFIIHKDNYKFEFYDSCVLNYSGPKKFIQYPQLIRYYQILFHSDKYTEYLIENKNTVNDLFNPEAVMESLYYMENYDFFKDYKEGHDISANFDKSISEGFLNIARKITKLLNLL